MNKIRKFNIWLFCTWGLAMALTVLAAPFHNYQLCMDFNHYGEGIIEVVLALYLLIAMLYEFGMQINEAL